MKIKNRISSIRTQIIMEFFILISLSIGAFMIFSVSYTRNSLEDNSKKNSEELVQQVNYNIENYIDYMENISQVVMHNTSIERYLFGEELEEKKAKTKLGEEFQTMLKIRKDICNIAVLGEDGRHFINSGQEEWNQYARLDQKDWYQKAKEAGEGMHVSSSHVQNIVKGRYDWVVTMSHGLVDPKSGQVAGMLLIDLNYNVINDLCEAVTLGKRGYVYIVDAQGGIVCHPQQQLILSNVKKERLDEMVWQEGSISDTDEGGEEKIYTPFHSEKTGWTIVGVVYASELVEKEDMVRAIYLLIAVLLILLAIVMAVVMAGNITRPVKQLKEAMDKAREGEFQDVQVQAHGENEISKLQEDFNRMIHQIDGLIQKNLHDEEEKREIEMKALQSQINPHFLYNTLDSIIWMIESEEPDRAIRMTSALARFFRQAIGKSDVFVTLKEELEYTRNYLVIQKMRYEDKVDYKFQVEEEIQGCHILKLVLQPLVENALYHGLKYKESKGSIQIIGIRQNEKIVIKVSDNGVGMEEEVLRHIFDPKPPSKNHSGVGLSNIRRRMQLYYGDLCEFKIESEKDVGTTVKIVIPQNIQGGTG